MTEFQIGDIVGWKTRQSSRYGYRTKGKIVEVNDDTAEVELPRKDHYGFPKNKTYTKLLSELTLIEPVSDTPVNQG